MHRGEVLLLMGPSGSGKSTLLQVLGCIRQATAGSIFMDERPVHGLTESELSQLRCDRMGFVFQHYNLLPSLRAWENVDTKTVEVLIDLEPGVRLPIKSRVDIRIEESQKGQKLSDVSQPRRLRGEATASKETRNR